jgi:hypothetical protein
LNREEADPKIDLPALSLVIQGFSKRNVQGKVEDPKPKVWSRQEGRFELSILSVPRGGISF